MSIKFANMRYLLAFILILFTFSIQAQNRFPSIDSAKNYILRYVKNSAVETFTNWRMQNVTYGTLELLDSLAVDGALDSIFIQSDTLKYSKGGVIYTVGSVGGTTPTLQQVTTAGNSTTDSIISPVFVIDGITSDFAISEDGAGSGALAIKNRNGTYPTVRIGNQLNLKNSAGNATVLLKSPTAADFLTTLPDTTGNLSVGVKVNGITHMAGTNGITDVGEINMNAGGGSSVNYYLNGSVNQGTFGGTTYYELSKTPVLGAGTNFTRTNAQGDGYIASFITDAGDPGFLNIPAGNWVLEFYFQSNSSGGTPAFYGELYKVDTNDVFTLIASGSANPENITNGTAIDQYFTSIAVPQTSLLITDRLAIRVYVITGGRTITLHTEDANLSEVVTTFSTGLTALNGLTSQVQNFTTGTSGTDFNISSSTSTHTFNLPTASAINRGALSSSDWSAFNNKVNVSDTAAMLTPYLRKVDTLSLSNRIDNLSGGISWTGVDSSFASELAANGEHEIEEFKVIGSSQTSNQILPGNKWGFVAFSGSYIGFVDNGVNAIRLGTRTSTSAAPYLNLSHTGAGNAVQAYTLTSDYIVMTTRIKIPNLSDSTNSYNIRIGLTTTFNQINEGNGCFFTYDSVGTQTGSSASANWQALTAATNVRTFTNTNTAVSEDTWVKLRIVANNSNVFFYVNNTLVATHTTNIPTSGNLLPFIGIRKTAGSTERTLEVDYSTIDIKYSTAR